mgnify:FL=1
MQDPLKQGLKLPTTPKLQFCINSIRMQDPLKQGLKQDMCEKHGLKHTHSNARSTKTRIETCPLRFIVDIFQRFECKIH